MSSKSYYTFLWLGIIKILGSKQGVKKCHFVWSSVKLLPVLVAKQPLNNKGYSKVRDQVHSLEVNMYQRAEIYLPRKKKVREAFRSNTYRIFDEKVPERLNSDEAYKDHKYASRDPNVTEMLKTHNIPQPHNVRIIRTNMRFLNEPIVHMETENTKDEQSKWWLNTPDKKGPRKAAYSKESTQRRDYQLLTHIPVTRIREERNKPPATGIIPTLSPLGQPKELVEHMSFIHQYDSRRIHEQPYQGRRHGAFVWSERGAMGPSAFQSSEGLRSDSEGKTYNMNSSQHAPLSSPQMCVSTGTFSTQSSPDHGNS